MKLSEVLSTDNIASDEEYLVFYKYKLPIIRLHKDSQGNIQENKCLKFKVREVNPKYLYYYLISNMNLFKDSDTGIFTIKDIDSIYNIEIDDLTEMHIGLQKSLAEFMDEFYEYEIIPLEKSIKSLFKQNREFLHIQTEELMGKDGDDVFEILDNKKFIKSVRNGKFKDPIKSYSTIYSQDLLYPAYLEYYLYYHYMDVYHFRELNTYDIDIPFPPIGEQHRIVEEMKNRHNKMLQLQEKKRKAKLVLREASNLMIPYY